jgi:hypothetical protein
MTTIPDYLILMAMAPMRDHSDAARRPVSEPQVSRDSRRWMPGRIGRRLTRWAVGATPAVATTETLTPSLRDYPSRVPC